LIGFYGNIAASAIEQGLANFRRFADECSGVCVNQSQAAQQALGCVAAAGDVVSVKPMSNNSC
ncbi:MAG: hypothetical protein ACKOD8_03550, partial [Limnohabitans sp.]